MLRLRKISSWKTYSINNIFNINIKQLSIKTNCCLFLIEPNFFVVPRRNLHFRFKFSNFILIISSVKLEKIKKINPTHIIYIVWLSIRDNSLIRFFCCC